LEVSATDYSFFFWIKNIPFVQWGVSHNLNLGGLGSYFEGLQQPETSGNLGKVGDR
jgi:hypothetical protein